MIAKRYFFAAFSCLIFAFVTLSASSPSHASGDICTPALRFDLNIKMECAEIAALSPSNDTRMNLLMLLFDRHGVPPAPLTPVIKPIVTWLDVRNKLHSDAANVTGYADGDGSRCRSNDTGATSFEAAVKAASSLSAEDQAMLLAARNNFKLNCAGANVVSTDIVDVVRNAKSGIAKSFAIYLRGAASFYGGQFKDAQKDFESLKGNADPWLADTVDYMVARAQLNGLQVDAFDEYGSFRGTESIDQGAASRTEASLQRYLKDHPDGRYANSARGLLRRVDWLAGWNEKLAVQYASLLQMPAPVRGIDDISLIEEIDAKLLPNLTAAMTKDPMLLAILDLKSMRKPVGNKPPDALDLEAQREAFGAAVPLYDFLKAANAFYIDGASAPVLKGLPDETRRRDGNYLWFSRQFLRGQALQAAGDRNTRGFWKELYPGSSQPLSRAAVEMALALYDEKHADLQDIFAPGSVVNNPLIRNLLLEHVAGPALLRAQAHNSSVPDRERKVALFTLLFKELTRGQYAEFLADVTSVPPEAPVAGTLDPDPDQPADPPLGLFIKGRTAGEIGCPGLSATASNLARDPQSLRDRLCLAEFVRLNNFDEEMLDIQPQKDELGGTPSLFPGQAYGRAVTYQAIIDSKTASPADRAYALYRAVRCYEPTGGNQCGGVDVPKAKRKAWYTELKHDYAATRWAKELPYWW